MFQKYFLRFCILSIFATFCKTAKNKVELNYRSQSNLTANFQNHMQNCNSVEAKKYAEEELLYVMRDENWNLACEHLFKNGVNLDQATLRDATSIDIQGTEQTEEIDQTQDTQTQDTQTTPAPNTDNKLLTPEQGVESHTQSIIIGSVVASTVAIVTTYALYSVNQGIEAKKYSTDFYALKTKYSLITATDTDAKGTITARVASSSAEAQVYRDTLKAKWDEIFQIKSPDAWLVKSQILDEIDRLNAAFQTPLIEFEDQPRYLGGKGSKFKAFSPLVRFENLDRATANAENLLKPMDGFDGKVQSLDQDKLLTPEQMETFFNIEKESPKGSKVIKWLHNPDRFIGRKVTSNIFMRFATWLLGKIHNKPFSERMTAEQKARSIAAFSLGLGITPGEVLNEGGKRVYRGPMHLFGKTPDNFSSHNDWFIRDLTDTARDKYFAKVKGEETGLRNFAGESLGSRYASSVADARVSVNSFKAGALDTKVTIFGKLLTADAAEVAAKSGQNMEYPEGEFPFKVRDMLGIDYKGKAIVQQDIDGEATEKNLDRRVAGSQQRLLEHLYADMNKSDVHMVKQRLAPQDGHNFRFPIEGEPLSNLDAIEFLKTRLPEGGSTDEFDKMIDIFKEQETKLGRPSQSTIDILGTQKSVSELAASQDPAILAQNSRKIMILRHGDSYSLHVFVDATGVGKVYVDPVSGKLMNAGDFNGDMQFGPDTRREGEGPTSTKQIDTAYKAAPTAGQNFDGGKLTNEGAFVDPETGKVTFTRKGSTVISFYFAKDFRFTDQVTQYTKGMERLVARGNLDKVPEIKVQAGDILLEAREEKVLMDLMESVLDEKTILAAKTYDDLLVSLKDKYPTEVNGIKSDILAEIEALEKKALDGNLKTELLDKSKAAISEISTLEDQLKRISTQSDVTILTYDPKKIAAEITELKKPLRADGNAEDLKLRQERNANRLKLLQKITAKNEMIFRLKRIQKTDFIPRLRR